jgi:dTDP-4-dehydrorhamnose reductase
LVIGASGLVGGNCVSHLKAMGFNVIGTHLNFPGTDTVYYNASDASDPLNCSLDDLNFIPDVIINCAALTNVDYCEKNPEESFLKTVISSRNVLKLAKLHGAKLIYLSTDYIFDGENGPYSEEEATHPLGVYGAHKLIAEQKLYLILIIISFLG